MAFRIKTGSKTGFGGIKGRADHGGDIFAAARAIGGSWREVIDYSANINPLGPPPGLRKHLFDDFGLVEHYPEPFAWSWRQELAAGHGLSPDQVLAGNGTTGLFYLTVRVLKPSRPAIVAPAFSEYEEALARTGLKARLVACRPEDDFDLTSETVRRVFDLKPDLVFLANPSSPAGQRLDPDISEQFLIRAKREGVRVALDEAFLDFTSDRSLAGQVRRFPGLIVFRSMTKFYALPGLRLGYLTAATAVSKQLNAMIEPWLVNALAQAAGIYCLKQEDYAARTRKFVAGERAWLTARINKLGLGQVIPGVANYLLIRIEVAGLTEEGLIARLRERGILVRGCASFQGLLKGYIRIAVKSRSNNLRLIQALTQVLQEFN